MGVVYRAEDLQRGGAVALKTLLWGDPAAVLRFKQEFRAIADITHPNLATLFELVSEDERLFFTMELVEGVDFAEWVHADPARLRPAFAHLAQGLIALHSAGCIHRDLKPSNVRVSHKGRVVILDFGLSATLGSDGAHQSTVVAPKGTPAYMAPEQAQGRPVTTSCDWYSVGVMLYQAVAGRLPFDSAGWEVLIEKQREAPPLLSEVEPSAPEDLVSLCAALLETEPERRPDGAEVLRRLQVDEPVAAPAEPAPRMVGRDTHRRVLHDSFETTRERCPALVFVHGYSGMGKTTLVQSFLEEVGRSGALVFQGKCYERESVPYKALDGPIDELTRYLGRLSRLEVEALLPRDVHSIARVFPVLRKVEAIAQAPPPASEIPDPQEVRRRAFAGLREVIARIADRRPLVICADDLQWGDADSADLLKSLLRPPDAPAVLFLGSYRREDEHTSPFLEALREPDAHLPAVVEIPVDPLSEEEATTLAAMLLEGESGAARSVEIARESGGSPFFVRELAALGDAIGGTEAVTLEQVLRRRIASLPKGAEALLDVVAIAGGPVARATAAFAARLEEAPSAMLAALRSTRLARVTGPETGEELDTYHDRVRETVIAGLAPERRRELHRRLGHALAAEPDVDREVLGSHFEGAGDPRRAGAHYAKAAENAHRALAFDHAARLYRKALELLDPSGDERSDLLRRLGDALADGGRGAEAGSIYLEAAEGVTGVKNVELRIRAGHQLLVSGHFEEGEAVMEPIERELGIRLPVSPWLARLTVVRDLILARLHGTRYRARDPATIPKAALLKLQILHIRGNYLGSTDMLRGLQYQFRGLRYTLKLGHPAYTAMAVLRQIAYESAAGVANARRIDRLHRIAERAVRDAGTPIAQGYLDFGVGVYFYLTGQWNEGRESFQKASRRFREECVGSWWERHAVEFWWLVCLDYLGEFRELRTLGDRFLRDAAGRGHLFLETDLRVRIMHLADLIRDAPERAREGIERATATWPMDSWTMQRSRWLDSSIQVALYGDVIGGARELVAREWPGFRRSFLYRASTMRNPILFGRDKLVLAEIAARPKRNRTASQASKLAGLGRHLLGARHTFAQGWGQLVRAGAAALSSEEENALGHLRAAEDKFTEMNMAAYRAVTRRRRGQILGGDEGRELVAESDAWVEDQGVRNPAAWARMYAPGFTDYET
jgi:tetratricopeptide (TPR) repeat protein